MPSLRYLLLGILALGSFATNAQALERYVRKAIRPFVKAHGPPTVIKKRNFSNDTVVVFRKGGKVLYVFVKPDGSVSILWHTPQHTGGDQSEQQSTPPQSSPSSSPDPNPDEDYEDGGEPTDDGCGGGGGACVV